MTSATRDSVPNTRRLAGLLLSTVVCLSAATGLAAAESPAGQADIVFGGDAAYPPYEWLRQGRPTGFNVELAAAIAAAGGRQAAHRLGDWPDIVAGLESGAIDVVPMFRSPERERRFAFSRSFDIVSHAIFAGNAAPGATSLADLADRSIVVEERSYAHDRLLAEGMSGRIVLAPNTAAALAAVSNGLADYAVLAEPSATYLAGLHGHDLRKVGSPLWPVEYAFAVHRERADLAAWLDSNLGVVIESGRYAELQQGWLAVPDPGSATRGRTLVYVSLACALLLVLLLAWGLRRLRHRLSTANSQIAWAQNHVSDTGLAKPGHFVETAQQLLDGAATRDNHQVVVLQLAAHDRTVQTYGADAALDQVRDFARRLENAVFAACGQVDRKTFAVFGEKRRIARELRPLHAGGDTIAMKLPLPRIFAGAATCPQHGERVADLLRRAESALAHAVQTNQAWVDFRKSMEPSPEDDRLLELFRARGAGQLHAEFQPQIDLKSGNVVGAEALARWHSPEIGNVSPATFVPLLEGAGLVRHLTRQMISEAARMAARLRRQGTPCCISVNITGNDLLGWKLSKHILRAIREHGAQPADLKLELTETSVVNKPAVLGWKMRRLARQGIDVSIDDFGTGYSTFAYLSNYPVRELKIDQSFVRGMQHSDKDMRIVTSTIKMGHELGLTVVAEGVETEEALNLLKTHDCDRAQGFVISRPLAEAEFLKFVARRGEPQATEARDKVTRFRKVRA